MQVKYFPPLSQEYWTLLMHRAVIYFLVKLRYKHYQVVLMALFLEQGDFSVLQNQLK